MENDFKKYEKIDDIMKYYERSEIVSQYEKSRFTSPIRQIIHDSEINIIKKYTSGKKVRVLDIPIGTGRIARNIGIPGIGMDSSQEMIKVTSNALNNWELVVGNAYSLPFKNDYFDCVYSFAFVGHFNKENRRKLYLEINRILKNRGIYIFDVVYKESKLVEYLHNKFRSQYGSEWVYYATFNEKDIVKEIQTFGFKVTEVNTQSRMFIFKTLEEFSNFFIKNKSINTSLKKIIYKIEKEFYNVAKRPYKMVIVCQK